MIKFDIFKNIFNRENNHKTQAKATIIINTIKQKLTNILKYMLILNEKINKIKDKINKTKANIS